MSLLDGLGQHLAANGIGVWKASGIYLAAEVGITLETVPAALSQCIAITGYAGPESETSTPVDYPSVQLRFRGTGDPRVSRARAQSAYDLLHGAGHFALPDGTWLESCIGAQSGPTPLGIDANGRHEHVVNLRCEITNSATRT